MREKIAWILVGVFFFLFVIVGLATRSPDTVQTMSTPTITYYNVPTRTVVRTATPTQSPVGHSKPVPNPSPTTTAPKAKPSPAGNSQPPTRIYVVHRGDTLISIAKWYHVHHYTTLYKLNKKIISDPNLIYPGQRLIIKIGSDVEKVFN